METAFSIVPRNVGSFDYFALHGNIDAQAEKLLKELPHKVQRPVVKFDFSKAGRINSMGIALLLRCLKSIKEEKKAEIRIIQPSPMNTMLFKMTGLFLLADLEH
ncbi:MAG TPA: STAS domain-containing protein [Geobacteraceae bacterium]|jgi:anti-anti-sigma regulatory factor|nr:STAS domain-containing protein [Geobacteraceae bacterium]